MSERTRRRLRTLMVAALAAAIAIAVVERRGPTGVCAARPPAAGSLLAELEAVPCRSTGRVSFDTRDDRGAPMDALDPVAGPGGAERYLGVYHSPLRNGSSQDAFEVNLAASRDLIHWHRLAVLDPAGASDPTLRAAPRAGYLLAYEKRSHPPTGGDSIRVRWYPSATALLHGRVGAQVDLPRRYSRFNNGTPAFLSIDWHGSLRRSAIVLAFHYETARRGGRPGNDREAVGLLLGFRRWITRPDARVDARLAALGLHGSHGDRRQFEFGGHLWRLYEAEARGGNYGTWHVLLYDVATGAMEPLRLGTPEGVVATSFGNPVASVLPAPSGHGQVLVVTVFVFSSGPAAGSAGELVYYQPV